MPSIFPNLPKRFSSRPTAPALKIDFSSSRRRDMEQQRMDILENDVFDADKWSFIEVGNGIKAVSMDCVYTRKSYVVASFGFSSKCSSATVVKLVIRRDLLFDVFHREKLVQKELYGLTVSGDSITWLSEVTHLMAFINSFNVNKELTGRFPEAVECLKVNIHVYISFLYMCMLMRQVIVLEKLVWNWYRHWRSNSYSIYYGKAEIVKASQAVLCGTCHICLYYTLHKYCSL